VGQLSGQGEEVDVMTSGNAERIPDRPASGHVPVAELARRQGVSPISSVSDLERAGVFESDEELEDFLSDLYASRRSGLA
jgi:hypothetical protein